MRTGVTFDYKAWKRVYHQHKRLRDFGLTQAQHDAILAAQGGVCAICKRDKGGASHRYNTFAIDHDHKTGRVRGLLCVTCNTRLGFLEKYWDVLHRYVEPPQ